MYIVRDRPFNLKGGGGGRLWFFVSFRIYFSDNTRVRIFFFFVAHKYDKNSESDFFFFLNQNQNIFFSNIGNQNIFLEKKTYTPPLPLQVKWSFPNKSRSSDVNFLFISQNYTIAHVYVHFTFFLLYGIELKSSSE